MALPEEEKLVHESYGMVQILRVSGEVDLVGVDWPTGHHMELIVATATNYRDGVHERFMSDREIIRIAISDVQFAQLITGIGTQGVPCTIRRRQLGDNMKYRSVEPPPSSHMRTVAEKASGSVQATAQRAMSAVAEASRLVAAMLKGGAPKKSDLSKVADQLTIAEREAVMNLPYVIEAADEEIIKSSERGKAEVESYIGFAKQRLGEEALARAAALAIEQGRDPAQALLGGIAERDPPA